jgi:hypothetical protein
MIKMLHKKTQEPIGCRFIYGHPGIDRFGWRYCSRKIATRGLSPARGSYGVYCARHLPLMYREPVARAARAHSPAAGPHTQPRGRIAKAGADLVP